MKRWVKEVKQERTDPKILLTAKPSDWGHDTHRISKEIDKILY